MKEGAKVQVIGAMAELPTLLEAHNVRVVGMGEEIVVLVHGFGTGSATPTVHAKELR